MIKFNKNKYFERSDSPIKIIIIYLVLFIYCVWTLYPILNIITISLRPDNSIFSTSLKIIPDNASFANYIKVFTEYDTLLWVKNSTIITLCSTGISVLLSITAGYAFSRFNFKGKRPGLIALLVTQMFPVTMMILPMYLLFLKLNRMLGMNFIVGLVIVYVSTSLPFNIWMMKGYFDTIPKSFEESAYVDGAGVFKAFYKIILPLVTPAIALTTLFSFMTGWTEYVVARIFIKTPAWQTLPLGLSNLMGDMTANWGVYAASSIVIALPVVFLFMYFSKYLVGGLTLGGVKS